MKHLLSLVIAICLTCAADAQSTVKLHNLWARPQVHVKFADYTLSFKIKDIERSLQILDEIGDRTWGLRSDLDTARQYTIELYPDRQEYKFRLEKMMHQAVATFLLSAGQAEVYRGRKRLTAVIMDIQPLHGDDIIAYIKFFDPQNGDMLFSGTMPVGMYNQDIGID